MDESAPMSARYLISERDYVCAGALAGRPSWRNLAASLLLIVVSVVLSVGVAGIDGGHWHWLGATWVIAGVVGAVAGIAVIELVVLWLVLPWMLRRHYRRYKAIHDEMVASLLDEGVRFTSPNGEARLSWDKILKWRCNTEYVLIYPAPRLIHIIPATVTTQGFNVERLKAALTQHVGPAEWWL